MQMVDFDFKDEIVKVDFSLNYCYQCGTCSSACPVAFATLGEFNPRKIIEESILGLRDLLIKEQTPNVWLCSTCQMCVEECPQGVLLTQIFENLRNKIVNTGQKYPEPFKAQAKSILENSLAIPLSQPIRRRREQLGLPNLKFADVKEVNKLLDKTNFKKKLNLNGD